MEPLVVGTTAMFEVIASSEAFRVEARGWGSPLGHIDRYPRGL
jgi:hypothetical protein